MGAAYFEIDTTPVDLAEYLDADSLLEDAANRAYDDLGECAEDAIYAPKAAVEELDAALKAWAAKHLSDRRFWRCVGKSRELHVTAEDVAALRGEKMRPHAAIQDGIDSVAARVGMASPPLQEATVLGVDLAEDPGELPKTGYTTDQNDPRLTRGVDSSPVQQAEVYLVLSAEERAKGFVRPLRRSYVHTTCGAVTTMGLALCETYARDPKFYGATYCCNCGMHRPVSEFKWEPDGAVVGS